MFRQSRYRIMFLEVLDKYLFAGRWNDDCVDGEIR